MLYIAVFHTWLWPGNSGEYHSGASCYPHREGSGSSAGPSVGPWSHTAPTLSESMLSNASLLVCVGFCINSCWGGKTEVNAKATTRARGLNVLSDHRVHDVLFRAWRLFSLWAKFCFSFLLSEQECCVFERALWFPVRRAGCAGRPAISHDQPPL